MGYKIDIRKINTFNSMAKEGGKTVAENLETMLGKEVNMKITETNFIQSEDIGNMLSTNLGVEVDLTDPPYGHLLLSFSNEDAKNIAQLMLKMQGQENTVGNDTKEITDIEKSAIKEAGNIVTSGFIDGWANYIDTTINITTPNYIQNPGKKVLEKIEGDLAIIFGSHLSTTNEDIEIKIHIFPKLESLVELIDKIEPQ